MPNPAAPADTVNELSVSCHIAASPDVVWHALTNRQEEWWCPRPWRVEVIEQDRRPGGRSAMMMHGPNGEQAPQEGIYLAWDEGRRVVTTDAVTIDANGELHPAGPFMIGIWELAAEGDGTRYTARARHWTDEARAQHEAMGFVQGWQICAEQLKALCEG
jgi:uncharacterized protein YndB with AHSA1/START domain